MLKIGDEVEVLYRGEHFGKIGIVLKAYEGGGARVELEDGTITSWAETSSLRLAPITEYELACHVLGPDYFNG